MNKQTCLSLTPGQDPRKGSPNLKSVNWYLPTNQLNLMFMLANGLISGPTGFGRKYYKDVLAVFPGWIPLFANEIPKEALEEAIYEGKHLRSVIAEVDISQIKGTVQALGSDAELRNIEIADGFECDISMILVPAPLPATLIRAVIYDCAATKDAVKEESMDYANVPLTSCNHQTKKKLFDRKSSCQWILPASQAPNRDQANHASAAVGGAIALTCALGNLDNVLVHAARVLFDPTEDETQIPIESRQLFKVLRSWACLSDPTPDMDIQSKLIYSCLRSMIAAKKANITTSTSKPDFHQVVLDCLAKEAERQKEDNLRSHLNRLSSDLEGQLGLGASTVSKLLERHEKPFSRGLILFFLYERTADLLDFKHPSLKPLDYVVAALLFTARSGWMGLPAKVRELPGLRETVTHRMAALAHAQTGIDLNLGPVPSRVQPLREYLGLLQGTSNRKSQSNTVEFARIMGWQDLIHTRISLGEGDYRLQVDHSGAHLLLNGEPKAVNTEVDMNALSKRLINATIPLEIEKKIRASPLQRKA